MIVPQEIYHPLYEDKEKFIILITGGRGSGKSFNASTFIERLTFEMTPVEKIVHQILYTRYTMVSAGMSIIPEMMEKIDLDGSTSSATPQRPHTSYGPPVQPNSGVGGQRRKHMARQVYLGDHRKARSAAYATMSRISSCV